MKKNLMKKFVATGLVFTMVMGGASAAFAKGNDHDRDRDDRGNGNKNQYNQNFNVKTNININLNFNDMKSAEWALRYIASLASKKVFEGYEDGSFRPDNSVSRIEAITAAVRLMGLRDKAESAAEMQTKLNFKDADKIPSWAVGYVAVALENDLFSVNDDSVKPQEEANRLWATTLLVKALKLDAEARTKMNTTLMFKDANKIPAGSVGYIEEAIEKKLVDGFEDNTFRPGQNVTRAQLAALLDRTSSQLPDEQNAIAGSVSGAVYNNVLPVTKAGVTTQYVLHPDAFILRNGVKVPASAIQVGDEVKVRSFNNLVVFVEVTKLADVNQSFDVLGTLIKTTLNTQGKIATITIIRNTDGQSADYNVADNVLLNGDRTVFIQGHQVELKGQNQVVTSIDIK